MGVNQKGRHKKNNNRSIIQLQTCVPQALDSVSLNNMRRYLRHSRDYMRAYRAIYENPQSEKDLLKLRKKYKSHRTIFDTNLCTLQNLSQ